MAKPASKTKSCCACEPTTPTCCRWALCCCSVIASVAVSGLGSKAVANTEMHAFAKSAHVRIRVVDAISGKSIEGAVLRDRTGIYGVTDSDGETRGLAPDAPMVLHVTAAGYSHGELRVTQADSIILRLVPMDGEVVTILGRPQSSRDSFRPVTVLAGQELVENLGVNLAETLSSVPGFASAYNGPGATRPTLRGMGGDRVLMLEDGNRVGDLYWSASDHGVTSEPLTSRRIEVTRGPAGLLYGSNALGGVVNVVRNEIPTEMPHSARAMGTMQVESVHQTTAGAMEAVIPLGPIAVRGEASLRGSADTQTPLGTLPGSEMSAQGGSAGLAYVADHYSMGAAGRTHMSRWGVPGEFGDELIPGGHEGGVYIETQRYAATARATLHQAVGPFDGIEFNTNLTSYQHNEIENEIAGMTAYGARFEQRTSGGQLVAHHDHTSSSSLEHAGAVALTWRTTDLDAFGSSPGTRSGTERGVGVLGYDDIALGKWRVQGGLRFEHQASKTPDLSDIQVRTNARPIVKRVSDRSSQAVSGSLASTYEPADGVMIGLSLARSFRAPSLPDLYSDGPHLADFSYDIGSPALEAEVGTGADMFLRVERGDTSLEVTAYGNYVDNYIYDLPTGETVRVIRGGSRPVETPVFEARGADATFIGTEASLDTALGRRLFLSAAASYTRAELTTGDPLPSIPPLAGRATLSYEHGSLRGYVGGRFGAPQNRVPSPIDVLGQATTPQQRTSGYAIADAGLSWRFRRRLELHSVSLRIQNALNTIWRDHLSRIKDVAPQPGRNIQLTYRFSF